MRRGAADGSLGAGTRSDPYWDLSASGVHIVSRPIVIDGLRYPRVSIELAPRIRQVGDHLVDDSYQAVERAASQFFAYFTLEQLVMAIVALQVSLRTLKEHVLRKKRLQERWTDLARRMKKLRVLDEHLSFEEGRLQETKDELAVMSAGEPLKRLHEIEEQELSERRQAWLADKRDALAAWSELEQEDERLLKNAPYGEHTEDLRYPYRLTLYGDRPEADGRHRSLASAMKVLVDALQKPLSRTDQLLLEIALRRTIRASVPKEQGNVEAWERGLVRQAETDFVKEFPGAEPFLGGPGSLR